MLRTVFVVVCVCAIVVDLTQSKEKDTHQKKNSNPIVDRWSSLCRFIIIAIHRQLDSVATLEKCRMWCAQRADTRTTRAEAYIQKNAHKCGCTMPMCIHSHMPYFSVCVCVCDHASCVFLYYSIKKINPAQPSYYKCVLFLSNRPDTSIQPSSSDGNQRQQHLLKSKRQQGVSLLHLFYINT